MQIPINEGSRSTFEQSDQEETRKSLPPSSMALGAEADVG